MFGDAMHPYTLRHCVIILLSYVQLVEKNRQKHQSTKPKSNKRIVTASDKGLTAKKDKHTIDYVLCTRREKRSQIVYSYLPH